MLNEYSLYIRKTLVQRFAPDTSRILFKPRVVVMPVLGEPASQLRQ